MKFSVLAVAALAPLFAIANPVPADPPVATPVHPGPPLVTQTAVPAPVEACTLMCYLEKPKCPGGLKPKKEENSVCWICCSLSEEGEVIPLR
ncbi:hypothetical protein EJ04DRAFT_516828 [Polyplosphaeria fusca]|uniref:Uncharacterized protein n=1 Tax=Polyplosphaeria fusca TaxID=682080 RepID=A0A9P4QND7_9PLEO|nr:hypothetical protein EJ04DRAFT_516828 [Polyplosphaeria fusca]